jgi:predicted O-methyltransferase YrrM
VIPELHDGRVAEVLKEYDNRAVVEAQAIATLSNTELARRRQEFLLSIGPEVGGFLHSMICGGRFRSILEIGTAYGYSTVWLADAARISGGRVTTIECHAAKAKHAREQVTRAGLDRYVEYHVGDALEVLETLPGPWDIVLLDVWKELYVACFDRVYPRLRRDGFIVADNMISPAVTALQARAYRVHVRRQPGAFSMLLPIGNGIELTTNRDDRQLR